ncbi:MAG TPA: hypothetical protein VGD56_13625 [Gemmatirosa sp.]
MRIPVTLRFKGLFLFVPHVGRVSALVPRTDVRPHDPEIPTHDLLMLEWHRSDEPSFERIQLDHRVVSFVLPGVTDDSQLPSGLLDVTDLMKCPVESKYVRDPLKRERLRGRVDLGIGWTETGQLACEEFTCRSSDGSSMTKPVTVWGEFRTTCEVTDPASFGVHILDVNGHDPRPSFMPFIPFRGDTLTIWCIHAPSSEHDHVPHPGDRVTHFDAYCDVVDPKAPPPDVLTPLESTQPCGPENPDSYFPGGIVKGGTTRTCPSACATHVV